MELADFLRLLLRRLWLVALVAGTAALAGYYVTKDDPVEYERSMTFVVRPSDALDSGDIAGVLGELQQDGPVIQSVVGTLNSRRFRSGAAERGGVSEGAAAPTIEATTRSGSDVLDVHLRGRDSEALVPVGDAFAKLATRWVADTYRIYQLESLGAEARPRELPSRQPKVMGAALVGGVLLALALIFLEGVVRRGPSRPEDGAMAYAPHGRTAVYGPGAGLAPAAVAAAHPANGMSALARSAAGDVVRNGAGSGPSEVDDAAVEKRSGPRWRRS
ncbi:MAG: hypothetical protein AVDCRST_MAG69-1060 [uncultured Solirubrobacteraceae bacterium]|uniref:Polysaccharide chain length determinant N-terminal domain-containing protein n=1 Tax=uncultured Solirubrobacteraceae bacterium TaxID=1162706 RepID=A0A6J4S9A6_9ACTN|nr:MAG: hypothetical protein AVDCRST_MAG69-1060 [uncultured Solirubrobacteraceae bacterium]